ncbi:MAG TPA: DUF1786 family protein [Chloroflexota bacterium]|jgi:uncharacterized protein (DUF1786 family)|nr:DUF1786 family protein [Chloroflexota bacterium]
MQILTVDVGTGTQDILLFDSERELENCFKLVLPSPTVVAADRIRTATAQRKRLVLRGVTMGGGPCHWATMDHVRAGLAAFATPDAARTFDDDLDAVTEMGIHVVSDDEAIRLADDGAELVFMQDLALGQILQTFAEFGVQVKVSALAVAVFDHGAAPPGFSDRVFRFNYLRERLATGLGLAGFAFARENVPEAMTRLHAVAETAPADLPLLLMDTAPAAILGALEDARVKKAESPLVANVGNFHCLAFHLLDGQAVALFEHHTGELNAERLSDYVEQLGNGSIRNDVVFADKGHGALVLDAAAPLPDLVAVTGPRRALLVETGREPYLAVPHGDMMLAGNFGLLRAYAAHDPDVGVMVERRLGPVKHVGSALGV